MKTQRTSIQLIIYSSSSMDAQKRRTLLFDVVQRYGGEVFKKTKAGHRSTFWPKVMDDLRAKDYQLDMAQTRSMWAAMFCSAKRAWAEQKDASAMDQAIIKFMTEVIRNKEGGENADTEGEGAQEEAGQDEDDCFDEILERKSSASNKSPLGTDAEEDDDGAMNYDYVSLEDIEKNYGVDVRDDTSNTEAVMKQEPQEDEDLPFKIESYTSEQAS